MSPPRKQTRHGPIIACGYCRVSTAEQGDSGLSLESQRSAIVAAAAAREWTLAATYSEVASAKRGATRPKLAAAMADLESGRASALIVPKLDRLARSTVDGGRIIELFTRRNWRLVVLDIGLDLGSGHAASVMTANVLLAAAQFERDSCSERTKAAMAVLAARGMTFGRPEAISDSARSRIFDARLSGHSYGRIATALNRDCVPCAHGGAAWYRSSVKAQCLRLGLT
jgi:DNA invertase Pin-like site-specific DNA recombinase